MNQAKNLNNSFEKHNHEECISRSIVSLDQYCKKNGFNFTPVRKKVFEILLENHKAIGAYEVLDRLRQDGFGSQPPVVYRALDFLVKLGFVHKIERLNAFITCDYFGKCSIPIFLICRICKTVCETNSRMSHEKLFDGTTHLDFRIENSVIETVGVCPACS